MAKRRNPGVATLVTADDEEVAASNPLPVSLAAGDEAIGRTKITDGTDVALVTAAGSLNVNIAEGGGSVGGGTQYDEGDTDASITGTAVLWEDAGDTLRAVSAAKPLPVDGSGVTQPVSHAALTELAAAIDTEVQVDVVGALPAGSNSIGQVTANAGTNLNTSTLALETGGNLAGAATSLAVIDDWDQSDRAKVNSQQVSGVMIENAVDVTVKYAVIDAATSGNNTIVTGVSNKKIRVLSAFLVAAGTVVVRFESAADGTALTGQMNLVANTGFVLPYNPHGWFQTADSALLNLELSANVSVDGCLTYIEAE